MEERIRELELEIVDRDNTIKELRRGVNLLGTEDDIKKKILEFRAKMYSPVKIHECLQYIGIDVEVEAIKDIVNNIDSLSSDLKLFYAECIDNYEKEIKINPQLLKQSSLDGVLFLIDESLQMIRECSDNAEKDKYMKSYNEYIKTKTALLKDVVLGIDEDETPINNYINSMSDDYEKQKKSIFKMQLSDNIKVI